MFNLNIKNRSDENLFHVFSSEGTRGIKKYKRERPEYHGKKTKKENKDKNDSLTDNDTSTIDIRC